jgi:pSer/pThr/pTyr-binding forkhead associated (FHA) protein
MFNRVILRLTNGERKGQAFVLENETSCILGRSRDCTHRLNDPSYLVSRHHCQIKVSDPFVVVQDLGSLNGTYVNEQKIGQHIKGQTFEEALQEEHAEYPLWNGDELRIGDYVFKVQFDRPPPDSVSEPRAQEKLCPCDCSGY